MVKHVDDGIGRIVAHLRQTGTLDNTLILFLSDNGACYEWGPFGFDKNSRAAKNVLHPAGSLAAMGGPGSYIAYGSGWANLCNTPFRLYKHFTHEGGINTPFIVHWPKGVTQPGRWVRDRTQVIDIMPTLAEATASRYPETREGHPVPPREGISLLPAFQSKDPLPARSIFIQHEGAAAIQKGKWKLVKGKRFPHQAQWELYDLDADPVELKDLAAAQPELVAALSAEWLQWAARTGTPTERPAKKGQEKTEE
jgi:arylsulfatase